MTKRFTAQHIKNGYAAMGGSLKRPRYAGASGRNIREAIEAERRAAAKAARVKAGKKG